MSVLLTKTREWCGIAHSMIAAFDPDIVVFRGEPGDPFPEMSSRHGGTLYSFLSPWVVPEKVLKRFDLALNFHPAPPSYRGSGPYTFALYDEVKEYGVTCHEMIPELDAGPIREVRRFPVLPEDTVLSLQYRSIGYLLAMLHDVLTKGPKAVNPFEEWSGPRHTRKELDALMPRGELSLREAARRARACLYPGFEVR